MQWFPDRTANDQVHTKYFSFFLALSKVDGNSCWGFILKMLAVSSSSKRVAPPRIHWVSEDLINSIASRLTGPAIRLRAASSCSQWQTATWVAISLSHRPQTPSFPLANCFWSSIFAHSFSSFELPGVIFTVHYEF